MSKQSSLFAPKAERDTNEESPVRNLKGLGYQPNTGGAFGWGTGSLAVGFSWKLLKIGVRLLGFGRWPAG